MTALLLLTAIWAPAQNPSADQPKPPADGFKPDPAWKPLGKSVWFDAKQRKLIVRARVALREGALEHLLCLEQTKEHQSVLATDAVPRLIHSGLILAAGEPGG